MKIKNFLSGHIKENNIGNLLHDFSLINVETKLFFQQFGEMTKEAMIKFIQDPKNAYEIGKFGYYNSSQHVYGYCRVEYYYDVAEEMY